MPHELTPSADTGGAAETWPPGFADAYDALLHACIRHGRYGGDMASVVSNPACQTAGDTLFTLTVDLAAELASLRARLTESETKAKECARVIENLPRFNWDSRGVLIPASNGEWINRTAALLAARAALTREPTP